MFDNTRLTAELGSIHRVLSGLAAAPRGQDLLAELRRSQDGTTAALIRQALFADCLRVLYCTVHADQHLHDDEIDAVFDTLFSIARHYAMLLPAIYGEFDAIDPGLARRFLAAYDADRGPFGRGTAQHWPGLALCRRAAELGERQALERYESLLSWVITAGCHVGGISEGDVRQRGRLAELHELRRELAQGVQAVRPPRADLRLQAFLAPTRVFAAVQQGHSVYEDDPFDVEAIHAEARDTFEELVDRATAAEEPHHTGGLLLVLGDSGAGKTHLLRGFRKYVHEANRGFAVYAQLHTSSPDYSRYLLQHVVDALDHAYTGPSGGRTGLRELAESLGRMLDEPGRERIARLGSDEWPSPAALADHVNALVVTIQRRHELKNIDPNLLRVLLYSLLPDSSIHAQVYKYLRCEELNPFDRRRLGDVASLTNPEDPEKTIVNLARLMYIARRASLVLMLDQAERSVRESSGGEAFKRALDTLTELTSQVPSIIAVIACLSDVYEGVRPAIAKSLLDRLEHDPPAARLTINRSYPEIEAIVSRRLAHVFTEAGAVFRRETPVYPIPEARLRALVNWRTRDVLEWCHRFQAQCALAGRIVDASHDGGPLMPLADPEPALIKGDDNAKLDAIASAWNDALHTRISDVPADDDKLLDLVEAAAHACAEETGVGLAAPPRKNGVLHLQLAAGELRSDLVVAITNRAPARGAFGLQLETLRRAAAGRSIPVAVRTLEFPSGEASERALGQLVKAGGRKVLLDGAAVRTLVALRRFAPEHPAELIARWRRRDRPVSSLPAVSALFDLERLSATPGGVVSEPVISVGSGPGRGAARTSSKDLKTPEPAGIEVTLGTRAGLRAERVALPFEALVAPTALLSSGAEGPRALAQTVLEQALERDVPTVIFDRSGAFVGYAAPDWWRASAEPERARRLAERLDVRLLTPGRRAGRPVAFRAVPELAKLPPALRERAVEQATAVLVALMHQSESISATRRDTLATAIGVLAERPGAGTLAELIALLESRDDAVLARLGRVDERAIRLVIANLEEVRQSEADLFDPAVERLTGEILIGRRAPNKTPLTIIDTRHLGDDDRAAACISQALTALELACTSAGASSGPGASPGASAGGPASGPGAPRTLLVLDDAEQLLSAGVAKSPARAQVQELLRRGRQDRLGVMLVSQNADEIDLRSRAHFSTWLLGKLERRMIERLRAALESSPEAAGKLANLQPGHLLLVRETSAVELIPQAPLAGKPAAEP